MERMVFEIGVVAHFEAAHQLQGDFGPATQRHGHTYRVEVGLRGSSLRGDGTLFDLGALEQAVQEAVGTVHYRDLDEIEAFRGRNSTAEAVAQYLFDCLAPRLRGPGRTSLVIKVWESPRTYASYEASLA